MMLETVWVGAGNSELARERTLSAEENFRASEASNALLSVTNEIAASHRE
jgi:hypothetical protein